MFTIEEITDVRRVKIYDRAHALTQEQVLTRITRRIQHRSLYWQLIAPPFDRLIRDPILELEQCYEPRTESTVRNKH